MKNISVKLKFTLWTTILMCFMSLIVVSLIFSISDNVITSNTKTTLTNTVSENANEIEFEDGRLDVDDVNTFKDNVYITIYWQDGSYLYGNLPLDFDDTLDFMDKQITETTIGSTNYYVYDVLTKVDGTSSSVWVRGIIVVDDVQNTTNIILQITLLSLPIIILLGAIGCYYISSKTLQPIDKINKTAKEISMSSDLSLRIKLEKGSKEIKQLSDNFDSMFEKLEESFNAEKEFTSDVSHELRTPTAVILAQCEYAKDNNVSLDDKQDALETVERQAIKMSKLISSLLTMKRLDSGIEKAVINNSDLSELVESICQEYELILPQHIKLHYQITPDINALFDYTLLNRLLANLLNNAAAYGHENIWVHLYTNNEGIVLEVKDDGIGISKENQSKIWKRFYQADASRTKGQNGSMGLGLSMVAQIAKLHNATIMVDSEVGKGSLFKITFPK